ncbi:MAG: LysM peptidoglycan-binding domain-containing protein [Verrucomicrobiaceae bacterium]|nr:LysM peptidoglycan-binding domain-containing protein [Verrucomicrobiaceae bacterium]
MKISQGLPLSIICAIFAAALPSCTGPQIKGLPKNLPVINLHGSKETPPHAMAKNEYPFDENGDYKTDWVAGGGSGKPESDYTSWRSSHGGEPTPHRDYSPPKKKTSSKSKSKSSKGGSYTIKSGDSLSVIAARNGTTVAKLKAANGLKNDMIRAGKTLKIPK